MGLEKNFLNKHKSRARQEELFKNDNENNMRRARVDNVFRDLIKENTIELRSDDLDAISCIFRHPERKDTLGVVREDGFAVRGKRGGYHEIKESGIANKFTPMSYDEIMEFESRYNLDELFPLWEKAEEIVSSEVEYPDVPQGPKNPESVYGVESIDPNNLPIQLQQSGAKLISESDLQVISARPVFELNPYFDYPRIGALNVSTKYGRVNGTLIWCDSVHAVFQTPEGLLRLSFKDIISPSGKTYGEIEEDKIRSSVMDERKRRHRGMR